VTVGEVRLGYPPDEMAEPNLNDVAIFVRVLQRGGFAPAARELRVPTSTVSRTIARLEEAVGARLVQRTARAFVPTAEGRAFFEEASPAVAALREASRAAGESRTQPQGLLRVTAPSALGSTFVSRVVAAYVARYPGVAVELDLSNRLVDLIAEGFDIAVRAGHLADSALVARKLGRPGQLVVASPAWLRGHALPRKPADLARSEALLFRSASGTATWTLQGTEGKSTVQVKGRIAAEDFAVLRAAALNGAGVALLPRLICAADILDGQLVHLLPEYMGEGGTTCVVYPSAKHVPPKAIAFRDLLLETCAELEKAS
jgi:DNA-binding transcriptional LysR family regulator